ncbi:S-4TM family putative pore-forming effector [Nostoc sp. DedQUE07]|uniref:S-4TM family putative pore-forming effector n=1 Tax=Nostoc sp. DedQUE07 TaxID=3075392 RepID=UPI002AD214D5|nr:S-4TM family putative pore-forming effector [Nostoc sp. DedQUE07]MDZ8133070.1 S-4TM family putative pore-forming effector [Nostoc sp. DedQUE07]
MLNSIAQEQNKVRYLDRIAASSYLYSKAKFILLIQVLLSVAITVIFSIVVAVFPRFEIWAAFYGISVSIIDAAILDDFQTSLKRQAAKVQELFDCELLHLDWNKIKIGNRPDAESINRLAKKFKQKSTNLATIENWYPSVVQNVPLPIARLICQRANCWWDSNLRQRYIVWVVSTFCLVTILVFAIGLSNTITIQRFFIVILAPLSPTILWSIREYRKQREAIETLERLKDYVENFWVDIINKKLNPDQIERESRELQDGIYDYRCNNPLIFNWIYNLLRNSQEEAMNKGAEELVEEALRSLNSGH